MNPRVRALGETVLSERPRARSTSALVRQIRHPQDRRSRHTIDASTTVRAALTRLPSRFQDGLVFCGPEGTALDPDNFTKRDFARVLRWSGLRHIRFHDLQPWA